MNEDSKRIKSRLIDILSSQKLHKRGLAHYCLIEHVRLDPLNVSGSAEIISIRPASVKYRDELLAVFLHEQLHAIIRAGANNENTEKLLEQLSKDFPSLHEDLETGDRKGINKKNKPCLSWETPEQNKRCTYEHLIVNWLEMQALQSLLSRSRADALYNSISDDHWIYAGIYDFLRQKRRYMKKVFHRHPISIPAQ